LVSRRSFILGLSAAIVSALLAPWVIVGYARRRLGVGVVDGGYRVAGDTVDLPLPLLDGVVSFERVLARRRSIRDYRGDPLTIGELSQILWASYGVSETRYGFKTAPSAGATYPLNIYAVVYPRGVLVEGGYLAEGSYLYEPEAHRLRLVKRGDLARELYEACLEQEWVLKAKAAIVITITYERVTRRYGDRGVRYALIEVGHVGQNVYLQATALGLATVAIGAFHDDWVRDIIGAPQWEHAVYVMPIARPAWTHDISLEELKAYIESRRG